MLLSLPRCLFVFVVAASAAATSLLGCNNPSSATAPPPAPLPAVDSGGALLVYVGLGGLQFAPANMTVDAGATVEWYWVMDDHSVTSGDGTTCTPDHRFDTGIQNSGFTFSLQFTDSGTYNYYCIEHCPPMSGSITVR